MDICVYGLTWAGRADALEEASAPPSGRLIDENGQPADFIGSGDVFIEGDNLEVLKLLEPEFSGKIRFIYIDPPYNTGKGFVYKDNFSESAKEYEKRTNGECELGRRHAAWLSMMYPRLATARKLLADNGIIFVSISEVELTNLTLIMDEIFGEENRVGIFTWVKKKKGSHLSRTIRSLTEFILAYGRDLRNLDLFGEDAYIYKWQPLVKRINKEKVLSFSPGAVETTLKKNSYPAGIYGSGGTAVELLNDIFIEDGRIKNAFSVKARTVWTQKKLDEEIALGTRVSIRSENMGPNVFRHDQHKKKKSPPSLLDYRSGVGTNEDAWEEHRKIFGTENVYSYPKPVSLIKYLIKTVSRNDPEGIYLDFFAGSGTTGQAVWELNGEDGGRRRFILIQSPESLNPPVDLPDGARLEKISELCKKRLEKVAIQYNNVSCQVKKYRHVLQ